MNNRIEKKEALYSKEQISISLIKEVIEKNNSKDNEEVNKINIDKEKRIEIIDSFFHKNKIKTKFLLNLTKYSKIFELFNIDFDTQNSKIKENKEFKSEAISLISLCILKDYINKGDHYMITKYLKILLIFFSREDLLIDDFFYILKIIIKSIIEILKIRNSKQYQIFYLNDNLLLFINDIIEAIINFPNNLIINDDFVGLLINLFKEFYESLDQLNIIIKEQEFWLKLLENNSPNDSLELLGNLSYMNSIENINDFLINYSYKNNIPNNFYNEIFKKSSIDLLYFINVLSMLKNKFKMEIKESKNLKIDKGIYLFGKKWIKQNVDFNSNEFSILLSFQILKKLESVTIFNLMQKDKDKNKNIIHLLINKDDILNLEINNDLKWNTNIKINKNIYYFICIVFNKKNKSIKLYVISEDNLKSKKEENEQEKKYSGFPKFYKDMKAELGDPFLYFILGDIFFVSKDLFNAKEYNQNSIKPNKTNNDLIKKLVNSKNYKDILSHIKTLKCDYIILFSPNMILFDNLQANNKIQYYFEYKNKNFDSFIEFYKQKGIEFLTFMIHNINSRIEDLNILNNIFLKIIEFITALLNYEKDVKQLYKKNKSESDCYFIISKKNIKNKLNIFFFTFYSILKNESKKYFGFLCDELWNSLLNLYTTDLDNANNYKQFILSILFDYELFDQQKFIIQINDFIDRIKIYEINNELIYKILLLDFIFESKTINHKNYINLINSFCTSRNKFFCKALIIYVTNLENEIKIYHYLKIIYKNIKILKNILPEDILILYEFIEKKFESIPHTHCKYCSYSILLCYLLKIEIIVDKEENRPDIFNFKKFDYMANPSYLFIRCIFIENFNLENNQKFKFIKSKGKSPYNFDVFEILKYHPFELYEVENFLIRFNSILDYITFLMSQKLNSNLKKVLDYFFPFILQFLEKIKERYANNVFIKEDDEQYVNIFYSSEELARFFYLYIKYNERKGLKDITNNIKNNFFNFLNNFCIKLFLPKFDYQNKYIICELISSIIDVIISYKGKIKPEISDNIFLFLISFHQNISKNNIINYEFQKYFPMYIRSLYIFLLQKNLILYNGLINLEYFEKDENTDKKNEINNKLVCEILLDVIFDLYFLDYYEDKIMISLIIENNDSLFYIEDSKNEKDNIESLYFQEIVEDFSFCLYFIIYFFNKKIEAQEKGQSKIDTINTILDKIFEEFIDLYSDKKKINSKLKKIKNCGKNFDNYNIMLDICNKSFKDDNFNLEFLFKKYMQIIEEKSQNKNEDLKNINKKKEKKFDKGNFKINIVKKSRAKSFDKKELIANYFLNDTKDNNNKIDLEEVIPNKKKYKNDWDILKSELSKIDINDLYIKIITEEKYSKSIIKKLSNPKGYFLWNYFTLAFKDFLFYNKKFKNISKSFKVKSNQKMYKKNYKYKDGQNYYLNYPTKIRNYIVNEYYRPFLKPCLNFFNNNFIDISHDYIKKDLLNKRQYKEDKLNEIRFKKIIPKINNEKYFCEIMKNKGNVFGYIQLNENFILFNNSPKDDMRESNDPEKSLPFLYSINDDKTIDTNKYVLIFYEDIKEIFKRRICLLYIGIEIFLNDNKSYLFNLFDKNAVNKFFEEIKKIIKDKNTIVKNPTINIDEQPTKSSSKTIKILSDISLNMPIYKKELNMKLIEEPIQEFKKSQLKEKFKKGELSIFDYLLLINKYSSRTYNDYNQYLVFPVLSLDIENNKKRDLSKPLCLNKENNKASLEKYISNLSLFNYNFSQHYSAGAHILFYLVRLIPFTYQHISFQSEKFDSPSRIFSSIKRVYQFFQLTEDNREFIPEFFYSYEFMMNLNYNNLGLFNINDEFFQINNVDTYYKYSFPEYIIKSRNQLEKSDLSPWIDNIFGAKQTDKSEENPNLFSLSSYEEFSDVEKIKNDEKIDLKNKVAEIKKKIDLVKFGMSPAKLFNKNHFKIEINKPDEYMINFFEKKKNKIESAINNIIRKKVKEKNTFYIINNNNENEIELIFKFNNRLDIYKLKLGETKFSEISIKIKDQIDIEPYNNSFCELFSDVYCLVRNIDNTLIITSPKKILYTYYFDCMITSIELLSQKNINEDNKSKLVFIGDEKGYLHLVEIFYDFNHSEKAYEIKNILIKKTVKAQNKYIKGLYYDERLNLIFSWSDDNFISINNDYSLDFMNIMTIGKNNIIKEILVSKYDLIYISCYNRIRGVYSIFSYTLNGIMISFYESPVKIIKCFFDEKIVIIHSNNNIFTYNLYTFDEVALSSYCDFNKESKGLQTEIEYCYFYPQINYYLMICGDNKGYFYKLEKE